MADLAAVTARLIGFPSVTGNERELADHVLETLAKVRKVERIGDCVIAPAPDDDRPVLTLVGHLDTVPPEGGNDTPSQEAGRIHGRGSTDMKGGLAVMLELAAELPPDSPVALALVFYPAEEGPLRDNGLMPVLTSGRFPRTDLAVVLEPTDGALQLGCLGSINAEAIFSGQTAHSARPWLGRNAIHAASGLLAALHSRAPRKVLVGNKLVYREVISATTASGGSARNVVPAEFRLNLNFRFAPGRSVDEAGEWLRGFAASHGAEIDIIDAAPAGPLCEGNRLLDRLLDHGLAVEPKQAWTDVAQLGVAGIDAVNYGPGETALAHTADESVSIDALSRCFEVLRAVLLSG